LRDLDPSEIIEPFLQIIKSGDTNGYITGAALTSVESFMHFRIIGYCHLTGDPHHPQLVRAISNLTHAVTRCKFEATDVMSDEIVLSRILKLLRTIALSECGRKAIDDEGICEMVEVAFGMYFQSRVSGTC
jgi:hypothetical protein